MTLEELKKEADRLGYRVVKKRDTYEVLLPCTCGCKRRKHTRNFHDKIVLMCCRCGRAVHGITLADARRKWNEVIREVRSDADTSTS